MNTGTLPAPATPTRAMLVTLGGVAALCGLVIVGAYVGSLDAVKANRRIATERAVAQVLPGARRTVPWQVLADGRIAPLGSAEPAVGALPFHAAYDGQGRLMGIAAEGSAKGYADTVRVMFGYAPGCQCVVGLAVVSQRETPGIGDRVITDAAFQANFKALDLQLGPGLKALAHEVKAVKHGSKTQAWQVDAISGATITSRAVARAVNNAAQGLLPRLQPGIDRIGTPP